jgi:type IV secretory pathway VirB2 component (pilin)
MRRALITLVVCLAVAVIGPAAWASTTSGLAIDTYLHNTLLSLVGPVAYGACLIGVVVAGSRLTQGGDLYQFLRTLVMLTVIAGLTLGGQTVINMMSANAAVVGALDASREQAMGFLQPERST